MKFKLIEKWFNDYVNSFDADIDGAKNPIRLKIDHSRIVSRVIADIGKHSGLSGDDLVLAETLGLLHDIGRFEQYAKYKTLHDKLSADHAHIGVKVLKEQTILDSFSVSDKALILKAIECHNAKCIPDGLGERERYFAQLVRDADKVDIYRVVIDYYRTMHSKRNEVVELSLPDDPGFSDVIINDLLAHRTADYNELRTINDFKVLQIGWVYDMNFPRTLEIVQERNYIDQIYEFLPKNETVTRIYLEAKDHVAGKVLDRKL